MVVHFLRTWHVGAVGGRCAIALIAALAGCSNSLSESLDLSIADLPIADAAQLEQPDAADSSVSTSYPAPHPPMPQLVNRNNGRVLTSPKIWA